MIGTLSEEDATRYRNADVIGELVVHPNHQRKGIATALVSHAMSSRPNQDATVLANDEKVW